MKRLTLPLMFILLLLSSNLPLASQDAGDLQPGLAMNISGETLPINSEADHNSSRLAEIEPDSLVDVLAVDDGWAQVEQDGVVGWTFYLLLNTSFLINVNGPMPSPRDVPEMAYDIESDRVILFGGYTISAWVNDTWTYEVSTNTWAKMAPVKSPDLGVGNLAYDIQSDRTILFYGSDVHFSNTPSETWAYDLNSDTWTNMKPSTSPPPMIGTQMVYDAESDRMILFGGGSPDEFLGNSDGSPVYFNETWVYDDDGNIWTEMAPAVSPPAMVWHAMAYDAAADRVILVPGVTGIGLEINRETWVYDYNTNTWEARETVDGPGQREDSAIVYAAGIDQIVLFDARMPINQDATWTYDFNTDTWTGLHSDTRPSPRDDPAMVYSNEDDRIVLFGGQINPDLTIESRTLETWIYDPNTNVWTQVGP